MPRALNFRAKTSAQITGRLNVLRSLLAAHLSASKTSAPLNTDLQLLGLVRKKASTARQTAEEFATAGRADLEEKERAEAGILDQYAGQVKVMDSAEVEAAVRGCVSEMRETKRKVGMGEIIAKLSGQGGRCEGRVERGVLAGMVKSVLAE